VRDERLYDYGDTKALLVALPFFSVGIGPTAFHPRVVVVVGISVNDVVGINVECWSVTGSKNPFITTSQATGGTLFLNLSIPRLLPSISISSSAVTQLSSIAGNFYLINLCFPTAALSPNFIHTLGYLATFYARRNKTAKVEG